MCVTLAMSQVADYEEGIGTFKLFYMKVVQQIESVQAQLETFSLICLCGIIMLFLKEKLNLCLKLSISKV